MTNEPPDRHRDKAKSKSKAEESNLPPNLLPDVIEQVAEVTGLERPEAERAVRIVQQTYARVHRGPLPTPEDFNDYERACPGAAREILDMAIRAQMHGQDMDKDALRSEVLYRNIAIIVAAVVVVGMVAGAVVCAVTDHETTAIALGASAGLSTLAGVFIRGRNLFGRAAQPEPAGKIANGTEIPPKPTAREAPSRPKRKR